MSPHNRSTAALIVAAGAGRRFGTMGPPKQIRLLRGRPLLLWTLDAFQRCAAIDAVVLVVPASERGQVEALLARDDSARDDSAPDKLTAICDGGDQRPDSVQRGLEALPAGASLVAVHDGARPLVTPELIARVVAAAAIHGAAIPALPARETVKRAGGEGGDEVVETLDRRHLRLVQTPQVYTVELLRRAYAAWRRGDTPVAVPPVAVPPVAVPPVAVPVAVPPVAVSPVAVPVAVPPVTDDAQLVERLGEPIRLVEGDPDNIKITVPADLRRAEALLARRLDGDPAAWEAMAPGETTARTRIGHGYDLHQLVAGRPLVLGGVQLDHPAGLGLLGHSDADVVCHAAGDAILGAAVLGDLGLHFPPDDPALGGISSLELLGRIADMVREAGYRLVNLDLTVVCQRPRLRPHVASMRQQMAAALGAATSQISVKATTNEALGPVGREEAISAHAVALLQTTGGSAETEETGGCPK
jgi:2-C-methyl-D-erythritol 2,4-cyclodiphosphate synthase/2-C-methyl-D-erythritol 4-phosphate cytidylyltransferase